MLALGQRSVDVEDEVAAGLQDFVVELDGDLQAGLVHGQGAKGA
jgi:hypothetical protein